MNIPTVAIVGRPNVGKSSLFNRFLNRRHAVVDPRPGITRDRNYALCDWSGRNFRLVDTGGLEPGHQDEMWAAISDQAEFAINESDVVLFVVDSQTGPDAMDTNIARMLDRSDRKIILVANKADNDQIEMENYRFLSLGLGNGFAVSATVGRGIGDLLDVLTEALPAPIPEDSDQKSVIRVAVVGRPNVGKSSFINNLVGENRSIVHAKAGTTRDAIDTMFEDGDQKYVLVDTAGLRRKYKVQENVEFYTNLRTMRAIETCDVAVVMIDGKAGLTVQDQRILDEAWQTRRSSVMVVNKWDLVEKDGSTADKYTVDIKDALAKLAHIPIIYISAKSGQRVRKVLKLVQNVYAESQRRIGTPELNEFLRRVVGMRHPSAREGKFIRLNYITQTEISPPTFVIFSNHPKLLDKSYISYISNQLRREYGFEGVPIRLKFRKK